MRSARALHLAQCGPAPPIVNADAATAHDHSKLTLIKAQSFALNTAADRGISDETEATRHRAHNQRRGLEADVCDLDRMHFSDN